MKAMSETANQRKIVIPGGSGYLGRVLTDYLTKQSFQVVILARHSASGDGIRHVAWDGATLGAWANELEGAEAVINLAGRSVNCRYNARNRQQIYDSRLRPTAAIGAAIAQCARPPRIWINASSATIYRHALDRPMDEVTGEFGDGFSVDVCQQWERRLAESATPHTRKIALRTAMVFGPGKGGVFEAFHRLIKLGLGGTLGDGRQFVSWIHVADFARSVEWLIEHEALSGAINCSSPNPLPNAEFMRIFREVCHQPIGLPATRLMLEVGAFFLRTETELMLKSRRVVPHRLLESGFHFKYPEWRAALSAIVNPTATLQMAAQESTVS
jgi:uncharacterized protein